MTNREAILGSKEDPKKNPMAFISKLVTQKKLEREDDEHGVLDVEQNAINDEAGYLFSGGKWKVFIKHF